MSGLSSVAPVQCKSCGQHVLSVVYFDSEGQGVHLFSACVRTDPGFYPAGIKVQFHIIWDLLFKDAGCCR